MKTVLKTSLIAVIIGIAYLSLTPTEIITVGNDKISHFIAYSTLMTNAGLLTFANKKQFILGIILCIFYGVVIEIIQHFVPGRVMSGWDMVANTSGVLLGVITTSFLYRRIQFLLK